MEKLKSTSQILILLFLTALAGTIGKFSVKYLMENGGSNKKQEQLSEMVLKMSNDISKQLPKRIDDITTLKTTIAFENTLTYVYELDQWEPGLIDITDVKSKTLNHWCAEENRKFLILGLMLDYSYYKNGEKVAFFSVSKNDCH